VPEMNVSVISFIRLGGNSRQVEAQDLVCKSKIGGRGDGGEEETRAVLRGLRDAALNVEG